MSDRNDEDVLNILSRFESLKEYEQFCLFDRFEYIDFKLDSKLLVVSLTSSNERVSSQQYIKRELITELEFIGLGCLANDYGKVLIRPETLADKVQEIFKPVEVDFEEDKDFSRKYYVLTDDEQRLREQMKPELLLALKKQKKIEVEISGRHLLCRFRKRISEEAAEMLSEFLIDIDNAKI
ncbi:MAG: hypothetical protein AAF487_07185 [Bacteroidota bacterium]